MHTHLKALLWPALALVLIAVGLGTALAMMPVEAEPWGPWSVLALAGLLFLALCLLPVLRWWSNTWTLTTRRLIHRQGILTRTSHDLPLTRINDIASERGLIDRLLGCGTLKLTTAAEDPVWMRDVPHVEDVHVLLSELIFSTPAPGTQDPYRQEHLD